MASSGGMERADNSQDVGGHLQDVDEQRSRPAGPKDDMPHILHDEYECDKPNDLLAGWREP